MKKIFVVVSAMMGLMTSCNQTVEKSVTGIVCDATMNGVTVVTVDNDTVFVSTLDAKDAGYTGNSFALNDTLTVDYKVMDGINVAESWQVKPVVADLIIGAWTKPISGMDGEDGFLLAADGKAASINSATLVYKTWKREGDKLIMDIESIGNGQTIASIDTMNVLKLDKDSLIFNDGREDVDNPVQKGTYYYLMSKTDGGMRPLPFHVKYRITNRFRIRLRNGDRQGVISCMFSVKPLLKNGDEMILSEFSNDTVFSYGKEGTKPLLVRTPAPRSTFPLKLMSVSACSRRFLFLDVIEKVYRRNIKKLDGDSFVYDYREKEIFTPVLVNSDFIPELPVEIDNMNGSFPKYAGASSIHSREFMQYYRRGNLQGRACEAASCLTRDDIYVLVLYHFN